MATFSARNISMAWNGVSITGFAEDSYITITPTVDAKTGSVGADKFSIVSQSSDDSGTCEISLQANAPSNFYLSSVLEFERQNSEIVQGDLTLVDPSGSAFVELKGAVIMGRPELTFGINAGENPRNWMFWCEEIIYVSSPVGVDPDVAEAVAIFGSL